MTTLSTTPVKGVEFLIQNPEGIPTPRFALWQRVTWDSFGATAKGTIIGLYWVDHNTALMERIEPGWHYMASRIFGVTDTTKVLNSNYEQVMLCEAQLSALEGVAA